MTTLDLTTAVPPVSPLYKPVIYTIKSGDTLGQIIANFYHANYGSDRYIAAKALVLYYNKHITNPDALLPGQLLRLMPMTPDSVGMCLASDNQSSQSETHLMMSPLKRENLDQYKLYMPTDPKEREAFWAMAWLDDNYNWLSGGLGAGLTSLGVLTHEQNTTLIKTVETLYKQYQMGLISKGQYDYGRRKALSLLSQRLGPLEKLLLKGQTAQQAIQIARSGAVPATEKIAKNLSWLSKLSKLSSASGVVLTGASLGMGCYGIAHTQNRQKKNEILVGTMSSTIAGSILGYALGVLLISTPVGWVTALALGAGSALASYGAGEGAVKLYDMSGAKVDFASMSGVDQICK